jgi:murein DD-endopeptidase MepM/ murein hydrolase activator NlpD
MKNKMNLMIFYADGRSRNIPFDVFRLLKVALVVVAALFISGTAVTFYNYYHLNGLKKHYTQTLQNLAFEKDALTQQIRKLKDFEEKISFFLSGAITDYGNTGEAAMGQPEDVGMGGGEDEASLDEEIISRKRLVEPDIPDFSLDSYESENAWNHISLLKERLEELAVLAVKKKNRLDFTPSIRPTPGYISSTFGWRRSPFTGKRHYHRGIDIVNKIGTPVKATASGKVYFVGQEKFWGNTVFIKHIDGMISKFGHLSSFEVSAGDSVHRGDIIGYLGMSGRSTGPHLHYQIEIVDQALNPMMFILEEYD